MFKKLFFKLLIMIMLVTNLTAVCGDGCMKCGLDGNCLFCDFVSGYILKEGACIASPNPDCKIMDQSGRCIVCNEGFFIDTSVGLCAQVPENKIIKNCLIYATLNSCKKCAPLSYLENGFCSDVAIRVPGCKVQGKDICMECDSGKILHPSKERCIEDPREDHCLTYGYLKCNDCQKGFIVNPNFFLKDLLLIKNVIDISKVENLLSSVLFKSNDYNRTPCQPIQEPNCKIFDDSLKCKQCMPFYYLDENKNCKSYPAPKIPNCEYYLNNNECIRCSPNFLLLSKRECRPVEPIENCTVYANNIAVSVCLQCKEGFYVGGNLCRLRTQIISQCKTYSPNNEVCQNCADGFGLSANKMSCLKYTPNCAVHDLNSTSGETFPCLVCNETFYLSQKECVPGNISDCAIYSGPNFCSKCINGFYWANNICTPHDKIEQCDVYSNTIQNDCVSCSNKSILVKRKKACQILAAVIPFCTNYIDPNTCNACSERYTLSNNQCVPIPQNEFCLEKSGSTCTRCERGYQLEAGSCKASFSFEKKDCRKLSSGLLPKFECQQCEVGRIPWKHNPEEFQCIQITERLGTNQYIPNCIVYANDGIVDKCLRCQKGYIAKDDLMSCVPLSTCPHISLNIEPITFTNGLPAYERRDNYHVCKDVPEFPNCKIAGFIYEKLPNTAIPQRACLLCKENYVPLIIDNNMASYYSKDNIGSLNFENDFNQLYSGGVECEVKTGKTFYIGGNNITENCEYFFLIGNVFYCQKCKFGYTGINVSNNLGGNNYVSCEKQVNECDRNSYFGNLLNSSDINLVNCHMCLSKDKIPFIFKSNVGMVQPFEFTFANLSLMDSPNDNGIWLQCLEPKAKSFKMNDELFSLVFPANCAIGVVEVGNQKDFREYTNSSKIYCTNCKPGFRPIFVDNKIYKCEKIKNCDNSVTNLWFNSCSKCKEGFSWLFDTDIRFDICVKSKDKNCLINKKPNDNTLSFVNSKNCLRCKNGFSIGYDGDCTKINTPFCRPGFYNAQKNFNYSQNLYISSWNINSNMTGCNECEENYIAYRLNQEKVSCVTDSYMNTKKTLGTKYVKNCRNFKMGIDRPICDACEIGYILSENGTRCVKQIISPDCRIINDVGDKCQICYEKYVLIEGFCEKPEIPNCQEYSLNEKYQKCDSCEDQHMLINNRCVPGKVKNCKSYNDSQRCLECFNKFHLVIISQNQQYCLQIPEEFRCLTFHDQSIDEGELYCNTCEEGYALSNQSNSNFTNTCISIMEVENCKVYDNKGLFSLSTMRCIECNSGYYLNNNQCVPRNEMVENCKEYSFKNKYCVACNEGYYLNNDKYCQKFPSGIYGCEIYKDGSTCEKCGEFMYLDGNQCVLIEVKKRIENCKYYETPVKCMKCNFNYFLNEKGDCELAKASNCDTYKSTTECATCPENFGFYEDLKTGYINCLYISTPNCELAEKVYPFKCIKCKKFYYSDEGKCMSNQRFIPFCVVYESRDTCQMCEPTHILSYDHRKCMSEEEFGLKPFENCQNNEETKYPVCVSCQFGYQFYKGQCLRCNVHTIENGCLFCEGIDVEICLICKPGYYQNRDGYCILNGRLDNSTIILQDMQGYFGILKTLFIALFLVVLN